MTPLLTVRQVAERLTVSADTVHRYCAEGKLAYIRIPAGKRFDLRDVQEFEASRRFRVHHEEA